MVLRDFKASMDWIAEEEGIWEAAGGVNVKVGEMILSVLSPGHRYRREDGGVITSNYVLEYTIPPALLTVFLYDQTFLSRPAESITLYIERTIALGVIF